MNWSGAIGLVIVAAWVMLCIRGLAGYHVETMRLLLNREALRRTLVEAYRDGRVPVVLQPGEVVVPLRRRSR